MKKEAYQPSWWPKVEQELRGGAITNLSPKVRELLFGSGKIIYESSPPSDGAEARAYVTTEDTDDNGKIDTVHMVVTNIEKDMPDLKSDFNNLESDDPIMQGVLERIVGVLEHELGHIHDHNDGEFPGGEAVAEAAERAFTPQFRATARDMEYEGTLSVTDKKRANLIRGLSKLANELDKRGEFRLADQIDEITTEIGEVQDSNDMSDSYDSIDNIANSLSGISEELIKAVPVEPNMTDSSASGNLFKGEGLVRR